MSELYAYTPSIWPSVLTVLLLIGLSIYSGRQRSVPGALPFSIACLFGALWAAGSVMEAAAVDLATKIFWFKFQAFWILPTATAFTCFVLEYAWPGRWLTRRNLVLLSIPSLLALGFILTNDLHYLVWRGFAYDGMIIPLRAAGNWIFFAYGYGLGLVNLVVFAWLFLHSPQHRWPVAIMITGQVLGRMFYLLEAAQVLHSEVPPVAFEYLMYAIALFGFRIFDPITLARQAVIAQMHEGMLVLDSQGQVADLNPAAEQIFHLRGKRARGLSVGDLIPTYVDRLLVDAEEAEIEVSLGTGPEIHNYLLEASPLKDWRGLEVGRLILLHDVTGQKRAQAQLLEQQRALAMLQEREQIARELHDSIGQTLGYAGFQVEAASKLIRDGREATAITQLNRLAGVLREAHADVREYILDLRAAHDPQQPFFAAVRHYLEGFTNNYGIQVLLGVDERLGNEPFPPEAKMQVFRILQEALSNARKHSQARCVQVTFAGDDDLIRMTIQDDGAGFDPTQSAGESHFGLRFMGERAEVLGGSLRVDSVPGEGTCVEVQVPVTRDKVQERQ